MIQIILFLHIMTGAVALAAAGVAVGSKKGCRFHRRAGKTYTLAMLTVGTSALVLALAHPNAFLFAIGVFSLYLVFTGWRAAVVSDGWPRWPDHVAGIAMGAAGLFMVGYGIGGIAGGGGAQPLILLAFGSIGLTMALADWRDWQRGPVAGKARIARHLGRMLGGTIATITAAGVVNLGFLPDLVVWLGPTALITPLIFWWTARVMGNSIRA